MGSGGSHAVRGWSRRLTRAAQVVPDLATFSVDDGFSYAIPQAMTGVRVGSIVRVPLGGRRVRGFVVGLTDTAARSGRALKEIAGISGDVPVFDAPHLETLRWAAIHYVAPLAALLPRSAPPNLPIMAGQPDKAPDAGLGGVDRSLDSPLQRATAAAAIGERIRPQYIVASGLHARTVAGLVGDVLRAGRSALVVAPTVAEAQSLSRELEEVLGIAVLLATSAAPDKAVTQGWVHARMHPGTLTVGTREAALWPITDLAMAVVIEEGRRGMKAPRTPTTHVRELLRRRAAVERFQLVFIGPVPTAEVVAAGVDIHEPPGRVWPLVEVVDRTEEPPGSGIVGERVRRAIAKSAAQARRAFVLVHRRGYAPAFRCVRCRTVRRCDMCGSAADRGNQCRRCGSSLGVCLQCGAERFEPLGAGVGRVVDDLRRTAGGSVGPATGPRLPVVVGTERDLVGTGAVDLAVAIDVDGVMLAPHYRAAEDALRVVARLAGKVKRRSGNRTMVQTSMPGHPVIAALRSGHPMAFLTAEITQRSAEGFPPMGQLMAIDLRKAPDGADTALRQVAGSAVRGPARSGDGLRWLLEGPDLRDVKIRLRSLVQRWRDAGAKVRVDVDPIDL